MHDAALLLASPSKGSGLAILVEMQHRNKVGIYVNTLLVYQTLSRAQKKGFAFGVRQERRSDRNPPVGMKIM